MKKKSLLTLILIPAFFFQTFAQTNASGIIKDQNGDPVPFVTISIKKTKTTSVANENGTFKIAAKTGDVLTFSAVGFTDIDVPFNGALPLQVTMTRNSGNVTDVVVTTALGVKRQEKSLGYSTAKISGDEVNQARVTNIGAGLAAKVSGLQVSLVNNGVKPGIRVTLRGNRSILGNNQALLVVDNNILSIQYLNSINTDDVESVSVLKGASASALYGSAASNGVIIVTTKKGSKSKPRITISNTTEFQKAAYFPDFQNRFGAGSAEYLNGGSPGQVFFDENPFVSYVSYENQSYGPEFNGQTVPIGQPVRFFKPDGTPFDSVANTVYSAKPNAKKDFWDKGLKIQNNISFSAGDDKSTLYMSFQDVDTKGVTPGDKDHRNTFRIDGTREFGKFHADFNVGYTITKTNTTPGTFVPFRWGTSDYGGQYPSLNFGDGSRLTGGSYFQGRPVYWTVINQPANIDLRDYKNWQTDPFASPDGYFNAYYGNVWWQIDQCRFLERSNDLIGNAGLSYKPFDWLTVSYRFSFARNDYNNKYTKAGYTFADWATTDPYGAGSIANTLVKLDATEGDGFSVNQRTTSDALLNFNKTVFKDFNVNLLLGNQIQSNYFRALSAGATDALVIPDFYNISNSAGTPYYSEQLVRATNYAVFGDITIGYRNFLFVHSSLRNDWSSLLSTENRSYYYPALDMAFVFTDAFKDKMPSWINYGKIRGAISRTAQVSIGPYALNNTYAPGSGFPYQGQGGYTINNTFANPFIKPESTKEKEIGLEMGFLKDKITLSVAFYKANTTNQTLPITISGATGFTNAFVNTGEMQNKGVELDMKVNVINTHSGFRWDVGGNFSYNDNTVLSLSDSLNEILVQQGTASYAIVGFSYPVLKVDDWERDPEGRIIVDAKTGNPTLAAQQVNFGATNPPYRLGLTTTFTYKWVTLNVVADGRFGAVIYNNLGSDLDFTGVSAYSAQSGHQAFVIPNSSYKVGNKYVDNKNITTTDGGVNFWAFLWNNAGSNYVNSADFWKLREVSLIFTLPPQLIERSKIIKGLSVGFVGRNLAMWKAKENVWADPEYSNTTGNGQGTTTIGQTPGTRFYGATVSITF